MKVGSHNLLLFFERKAAIQSPFAGTEFLLFLHVRRLEIVAKRNLFRDSFHHF